MTTGKSNKQQEKHRKNIDIPLNIMPILEKLAKKDNRDLKNFIENHLIGLAEDAKSLQAAK